MIPEPRIETLPETKLVGKRLRMNLSNNRTAELFQGFMPRRKEIGNTVTADLFCMQVYDPGFDFGNFTPDTLHDKWAAVPVSDFSEVPEGMETYTIKGGLYAVFHYKGAPADFADTFRYIFYQWFPNSPYKVDQREHFEIIGEKYRNNHPDSEEDIWVPIVLRTDPHTV